MIADIGKGLILIDDRLINASLSDKTIDVYYENSIHIMISYATTVEAEQALAEIKKTWETWLSEDSVAESSYEV